MSNPAITGETNEKLWIPGNPFLYPGKKVLLNEVVAKTPICYYLQGTVASSAYILKQYTICFCICRQTDRTAAPVPAPA
jgi:hypothetical protein